MCFTERVSSSVSVDIKIKHVRNDMKDIQKMGLRLNHLLFLYISIEITILEDIFQMTKRQTMSPSVTA